MAELRHAFCYTPAEMGARSLPTQPIPVGGNPRALSDERGPGRAGRRSLEQSRVTFVAQPFRLCDWLS